MTDRLSFFDLSRPLGAHPARYSVWLGAVLGAPAFAASLQVGVEVPRIDTAEYHRPYVAIWIESAEGANQATATLAVWYEVKNKNAEGAKWLKDMRQWWRRGGRELAVPVDGVTSPTRPVGKHALRFDDGAKPFASLPPGQYKLVVEAAREVGGREVVSVPFTWPMAKGTALKAQGRTELGEVSFAVTP